MTKRKILFGTLGFIGVLFLVWLGGLVLFVTDVASYVEPSISETLEHTDAIVVLTGGSERVQAGLDLLKEGKGKKLLISGVHPSVGAQKILAHSDLPKAMQDCCVILGHTADNTLGNAQETKAFMEKEGFRSLRLVTAHYHMPRSLVFFRTVMPDVEIVPHPVAPDNVNLPDWWHRAGTASLLISEYNKYLFAQIRAMVGAL